MHTEKIEQDSDTHLQLLCAVFQLPKGKPEEVQAKVWVVAQGSLEGFARHPPHHHIALGHYAALKLTLQ